MESSTLLPWIYTLLIASTVVFLGGAVARFIRHKEATVWYRGSMGLLGFAIALTLLEILFALSRTR